MVGVTMTTVAKEAGLGGLQPRVMRDDVKHTRVAGVLFWNFHARLFKYGPPLGSKHLEAIFGKKIAAFKTAL